MAHCSTILQQLVKIIPRHAFESLEKNHGTGRKARSYNVPRKLDRELRSGAWLE